MRSSFYFSFPQSICTGVCPCERCDIGEENHQLQTLLLSVACSNKKTFTLFTCKTKNILLYRSLERLLWYNWQMFFGQKNLILYILPLQLNGIVTAKPGAGFFTVGNFYYAG
jgi:hypothetical protein